MPTGSHKQTTTVSSIVWLIMTMMITLVPAWTATAVPPQHSPQRWEETGYGVSLQLPPNAVVRDHPGDGILLHLTIAGDTTISLSIQSSKINISLDQLLEESIHQLASKHPDARIISKQNLTIADRPGTVTYFGIPTGRKGPWIMGRANFQLDARTFVYLHMEATQAVKDDAIRVFEEIAQSLGFQNPKQVAKRRADQVTTAEAWIKTVTANQLRKALHPEQWLRVVVDGRDIGYMQITEKTTEMLGRPGISITIRSHIQQQATSMDSISNFFLSDDLENEIWSIRSTSRKTSSKTSAGNTNLVHGAKSTWVETGLRAYDRITVNRDTPTGRESHEWRTPERGYLSQVQSFIVNRLLVRSGLIHKSGDVQMGFYAYNSHGADLSYRTIQAQAQPDGTVLITTRPSPDQGTHRSTHSPDGLLQQREQHGGHKLITTSKQHISALWLHR